MATPLTISVLTPLQCEILKRIAEGASRPEIAKERGTSAKTTEYHCAQIMLRLGLDNVADLTQWALAMGLVQLKFKNETPEITLELLSKIHEARMAAQRANPFQPKDPNAPRFKKVLKSPKLPANPEPPKVIDPAGEDAWSEEMEPSPVKWPTLAGRLANPLTDTVEAIKQLEKSVPITEEAKAIITEPVRGQREHVVMLDVALKVPAQEQTEVATPEVVVKVPAQEHAFAAIKESEIDGDKYNDTRNLPYETIVPKLSQAITMPVPPKPVMGIDIIRNQDTMTFKPIPQTKPVKKASRDKLNGANFQGEYKMPPKCPKCGATHGKQWVCRMTTAAEKQDVPKKLSMSTFKMTPEALRLIGTK